MSSLDVGSDHSSNPPSSQSLYKVVSFKVHSPSTQLSYFIQDGMVTILSDDILVEILSKLPLKTLTTLKCISKAWHRLVSINCIRGHRPLLISGIFHHPTTSYPRYGMLSGASFIESDLTNFPFPVCSNSSLVDCSNGLLLFVTSNTFYVCCPVTGRWDPLPVPPKRALISVLAFDSYRSRHYKVVSFTGWEAYGAHLQVFSSETVKWVEREVHWAGLGNDTISANMRYFNGALHILAYPRHMVQVDLDLMTCQKIKLPALVSDMARVGVLGGHVSYASCEDGGIRIWVVEGDKWVMKHSIIMECGFNLLGFEAERELVYIWVKGKMVGYDLGKESLEGECELKGEMEGATMRKVWVFPASRYLLDCMTNLEC